VPGVASNRPRDAFNRFRRVLRLFVIAMCEVVEASRRSNAAGMDAACGVSRTVEGGGTAGLS